MYVFDASAGTEGEYSFLSSSSVLSPGVGYWLLALNEAGAWSMEMDDELNVEPFEIQLTAAHDGFSEQQNMVGNPSTNSIAWENTQAFDSSNNCYERPSVAATLEVGLIDNAINYYNGAGYTVCDDTGTNPPCEIAAGEGFWVNVTDDSEDRWFFMYQ